ncbi:MAG: T9SS type A sorting domain-containing protein, partial [Bacteroidota bacterium]
AVNGVPIFNVHTNTGVDSYLDGQLDNYGGHCGRADDYHYHIAPLHLYNYTSQQLPIAFALDGFAVYGSKEPDGSNMAALDGNHGHFGSSGVYHYHGTATAPYMIAKMVGQVTEDATHQLIPQPAATPVRPSLTPLSGALITSCKPNALNNGYTLKYLLNSVNDSIVYSWNNSGKYTFTYYNATGVSTNTYNGFTQCVVKLTTDVKTNANTINEPIIYPNPSSDFLHVFTDNQSTYGDIHNISIYTLEGKLILQKTDVLSEIDLHKIAPGTYFVIINLGLQQVTKKLIIQ